MTATTATNRKERTVHPSTRRFSRGRITGLTLIAVLTLGLGYLHFAGSSTAVSVPAGAHAGQLTLKNCTYNTEKGAYAADCGTLVVPENRADPHSRLIALPVIRIRAHSAHPGAPIFRLEGGPGVTNMKFADASRFTANHDVVLVGYRGVDGSVRLDCPEVESALEHSADFLGQKSLDAYSNALRSCAKRLEANGVDLAGYTLPERVDDLEAARKALGYHQIDLLSESAGTRTAMIYSWRYPTAIHRSVMIGVNPPGNFIWYPKTTDEQIARYASLCAQDATCHKRTGDLAATLERTVAHMPNRWLFFPIKKGNARIASFFGLMETTENASPLSGPMTLDAWLSAAHGDSSGLWFESLLAQIAFPEVFVWGDVAAVGMADNQAAERYYSSSEHDGPSIIGNPGTEFLFGGGGLLHAWPANPTDNEYTHVQTSNVQTLLIGGSLDFATPPQNATKELLPYLPNGHQVILAGFGHTTSFWTEQTKASTHLINTYFDTGKVDDSLYKPQAVKLHARLHTDRTRQGHRRRDDRLRTPHDPVTATDVAPGAQARRLRAQGERDAALRLPAGARPRRMVHRPDHRAGGFADSAPRQRAHGCSLHRHADRPRHLLGLGQPRPAGQGHEDRVRGRADGRPRRRAAGVQRNSRAHGGHHHDRRSSCRCEPRPDRPRRRTNRRAAGDRSAHRHRFDSEPTPQADPAPIAIPAVEH